MRPTPPVSSLGARARVGLAAVVAAGLLVPLAGPAVAAGEPPGAFTTPVAAELPLDDDGAAIVTEVEARVIAPGLELTSFARIGEDGWLSGEVLVAHLGTDALEVGYVAPDDVAGNATVTEMAEASGAVAAVNGDFFDINNSGAPLGVAVDEETGLLKSAAPGRERAVAFDSAGVGRLAELFLEGSATFADHEIAIAGLNTTEVPEGGVAVFDSAWGDHTRTRVLADGEQGVEVTVDGEGTVLAVGAVGEGRLPDGVRALVARPGAAADALATLVADDHVDVAYGLREDAGDVAVALGGAPEDWLLEDGEITSATGGYVDVRHPRTAVGFDETGTTAYFVVVDGRQSHSIGMTLPELGRFLAQLGADDAINLDGGGSSEMVARLPGDSSTTILNSPSDGVERRDGNGLGLFVAEGSGQVAAFDVRALAAEQAGEDALRVFPALHRTLVARGYDEVMSPVEEAPDTWSSSDEAAATVADGVVTGVAPGTPTITAAAGTASGELALEVLGPLVRTSTATPVVTLPDAAATASLVLTGHDAQGFSAPVEARDVVVTGGQGVAALEPAEDGSFTVRALQPSGAASFELTVGGTTTAVAVSVSLEEAVVADFTDAAQWTSANDRAPGGSVTPAPGYEGAAGLRLTYDFSQSTATRGQYAVVPDGGREIAGQPRRLTMWVNGDESGAWLRLQVQQGDGVTTQLDGPTVSWEGWQGVTFEVPTGVQYPLRLQRIRVLETRAAEQYTGELTVSDLVAHVPPSIEVPAAPRVEDPVIVADGATDDAPLRVAVMSDAQFVARDPESGQVEGARRTLSEIVAADPDVLVINGDLVDEASPADFDLARTILTEELEGADFPWYYLPGNHEIMGGSIQNFVDEFGERTHHVDVEGTRLILLDSSTGRLGSDFEQLRMLRSELDDAARDDAVSGVLVMFHHPLDDPLPTDASQLADRLEADTLRGWFEDFRATSGKSIANVSAHVGAFHASTGDGVEYVVNGNSGKSPASTPENGGFTGWSMLGVDPAEGVWVDEAVPDGEEWLAVEVNARADVVDVSGPAELAVGTSGQVSATLTQDDDRVVPVAWPVSAAWGGDERVHVGAPDDAPAGAVVALDPATHVLTAVAPGRAQVTVTVNGVAGTLDVLVPAGRPGEARLSDDNGWDTGLLDGDYHVNVDLWWGENATSMRLYEDGELIHTEPLAYSGEEAQRVSVPVTGRVNGQYTYTCELVNAAGVTPCAGPHTVLVRDANPGPVVLSHDNYDGDGGYTVVANKWWGTQATGYVLYEDGVEIDRQELTPGVGGAAQSASTLVTDREPGTYRYVAVLTNAAGETRSAEIAVRVR
ncbi:metallophosphoesterase [Beutenbergia cavernae DSM 12333]|uniref:Metallophosphoesterase n=1 Tax=Beutenbergia cavernae (strain ATCC BAA-8 / DSM 12333 / CCUG 43141 / JCM 11478 / NBRC 16432 / NCIMB 13614 / HKI 0122) TaxID=471853 RepID=C5C0E0_BEUC1|nr:phosphodiester glycosidase family protein [Beutenbergia cavernae]ACQ79326.1 metallophosphoesterase [Beutenbergia cavernae DSM 12333]